MEILSSSASLRISPQQHSTGNGGSSIRESGAGVSISGDVALQLDRSSRSLQSALSANAINKASEAGSQTQPRPGLPGSSLAAALSNGGANPTEWLSQSDVDLFHAATGGTIKDGVIYDKNGNVNTDQGMSDLVNALFDMRNFGTFSSDQQPRAISGAITAQDLQGYINRSFNCGT